MDTKGLKGQFSLKEFIVDFFGSLMPGVLFLFLMLLSFLTSIISSITILQCEEGNCNQSNTLMNAIIEFIKSVRPLTILSLFIFFLSVGYVIGTFFYRRDPKYPDYRSFLKIASGFSKPEDLQNWVVRIEMKDIVRLKKKLKKLGWGKYLYYPLYWKTKKLLQTQSTGEYIDDTKLINILTVDESEVQYPYNNLSNFLKHREREDLAKRIYWSWKPELNQKEDNPPTISERSKTFINSLKIRLQFLHPEKYGTINKNEAHIRLSSSMWYASTALIKFSFIGLFILAATIVLAKLNYSQILHYIYPIIFNISVISFAYIAKKNSEKFLHYQRVREIFYVLDTAELANQIDKKEYSQDYYFKGYEKKTDIASND